MRWWAVLVAAALTLSACGIQLQDQAQPLPVGVLPAPGPQPSPSVTLRRTTVYFTNGRQLEGVAEPILARSADGIMAALGAGPPAERQDELRSLILDPLSGTPLLSVVAVTPSGQVRVLRSDAFLVIPAPDQVLLIAQVVLSLDEIGLSRVEIVDAGGSPVSISLPDGRVRVGIVTPKDFSDLVNR